MTVDYRFRLYGAATSGVSLTINSSHMKGPPTLGGQVVDPLRGRAESEPWQADILDDSDYFSAQIADAGGRLQLLGRLFDAQVTTDQGATWQTIGAGRVADIVDRQSYYAVSLQDERYRERQATAFAKNGVSVSTARAGSSSDYTGTSLFPVGIPGAYGLLNPRGVGGIRAVAEDRDGSLIWIRFLESPSPRGDPSQLSLSNNSLNNMVRQDLTAQARVSTAPTQGSFQTLRANIDGADYEVASFAVRYGGLPVIANLTDDIFPADNGLVFAQGVWVVDASLALSTGAAVTSVYMHMPTAPPSTNLPLHIGGARGMAPFQLLKDLYDNAGVRYSSSAMDDLVNDPRFGLARWRVTGPANLANWVDDHIYGAYGVLPFINSSGELAPKSVLLPQNLSTANIFRFTAANARAPHPEWIAGSRDMVTAVRFFITHENAISPPFLADGDWPGDLLAVTDNIPVVYEHDRLIAGMAPRKELEVQADGLHVEDATFDNEGMPHFLPSAFGTVYAREIFERYGDGPIRGTIAAMSTAVNVQPGEFAEISIPTFPSPQTGSRGGARIVQILSRRETPGRFPEFDWIDAGPSAAALSVPTITLVQSTSDANHMLKATIGNLGSSSVGFQLQAIYSSAAAAPASSASWMWAMSGASSGNYFIGPFGNGKKLWAQVRATQAGRIRSAFSTAVNSTTAQLAAPTALAGSSYAGGSISLTWVVGTNDYSVEVRASTQALSASSTQRVGILPPGSNRTTVYGLTPSSTYNFGVRHIDTYGGVGLEATLSTQTTATKQTAPNLGAIRILRGATS